MFRRFWWPQATSSTPSQHQTSVESPFNDNTATSSATAPFLNVLTRKLVFYMSAVFIWGIAAVFGPVLLLFPLISLPIIRVLMSITHGEAYANLTQARAHNKCIQLANTLSNAKEVIDCLDKMLSWLLISIVCFAMWLHLTGLATTQDLFVIASPFVVVAAVSRDACNILVKGIMFVYAMHPFDVGDLCVIDEQMMEVRTIDIWKTSFLTIDTHEEVVYSNSYLFDIHIINFKTDFDWSASIMLEASSLDAGKIKDLKQKIEEHLNKKDRFTPDYNNHVEVVTVGDNIKMVVKFRLNGNNLKNSTYAECFKEKCRLHSEFILYAQSLMDQIKLEGSPFSEKFVDSGQEKRDDAASSSAAAAKSKSKS